MSIKLCVVTGLDTESHKSCAAIGTELFFFRLQKYFPKEGELTGKIFLFFFFFIFQIKVFYPTFCTRRFSSVLLRKQAADQW